MTTVALAKADTLSTIDIRVVGKIFIKMKKIEPVHFTDYFFVFLLTTYINKMATVICPNKSNLTSPSDSE